MRPENIDKRRLPFPSAPRAPLVWKEDTSALPWFDKPNALDQVENVANRWQIGERGYQLLAKWATDGFFTIDDLIPAGLASEVSVAIDEVWFHPHALCDVVFYGVELGDGAPPATYAHEDLIKLPRTVRETAKAQSNWRIAGLHERNRFARALFNNDSLRSLCSAILDRSALPRYSLGFAKGSEQHLHDDMSQFHVFPRNFIVGAWIACEDITDDSGPLFYHPGSHKERMFPEFTNYPQTQRRTADREQLERYDTYVRQVAAKYPRKTFTGCRGSVMFWHGMLLHGGTPILKHISTRKSFVVHFLPDDVDQQKIVVGPFNW